MRSFFVVFLTQEIAVGLAVGHILIDIPQVFQGVFKLAGIVLLQLEAGENVAVVSTVSAVVEK